MSDVNDDFGTRLQRISLLVRDGHEDDSRTSPPASFVRQLSRPAAIQAVWEGCATFANPLAAYFPALGACISTLSAYPEWSFVCGEDYRLGGARVLDG
jgi:hypothetical protein